MTEHRAIGGGLAYWRVTEHRVSGGGLAYWRATEHRASGDGLAYAAVDLWDCVEPSVGQLENYLSVVLL